MSLLTALIVLNVKNTYKFDTVITVVGQGSFKIWVDDGIKENIKCRLLKKEFVMLKALQTMQTQELGVNLKALDVPKEQLDNYNTVVYKSTHSTTTTTIKKEKKNK